VVFNAASGEEKTPIRQLLEQHARNGWPATEAGRAIKEELLSRLYALYARVKADEGSADEKEKLYDVSEGSTLEDLAKKHGEFRFYVVGLG